MIRVRLMTAADIPLGMRLKQQAGWNQREADWTRLLEMEPDGCFVAEWNGAGAGTVTTCIFDSVAWIAMMLVDEALRGRGIGRALMEQALAFVDGRGVQSVRLDATPLGRPLYENLGFAAQFSLSRYEGRLPQGDAVSGVLVKKSFVVPPLGGERRLKAGLRTENLHKLGVQTISAEQLDRVVELDRIATATNRRKLLARLYAERPDAMRVVLRGEELRGYLTVRPGLRALQIGPCIADVDAGPALLRDACRCYAGEYVFLDVPEGNRAASQTAHEAGLHVQRQLLRMCRGEPLIEQVEHLWASSGPEKG